MPKPAIVTAVTATSYTNAWTLHRACKLLGVELYTSETEPMMPLPTLSKDVEPDWLFFTEEGSLRKALEHPSRAAFFPRVFPPQLFDDKWAFGEWLLEDEACGMPPRQWSIDSAAQCQYPVTLKPRHSWMEGRRLPRGWVCRNETDLNMRLAELDQLACRREWYFLQEWLDETRWRVISTCGFFDARNPERNLTCTVERILPYGPGVTGSAAVATIPDAWQLMALTRKILQRLDFVGPFEIEFLVDHDRVIVLELNPRFWMQHGLFVAAGNGLVKRYLERDT